jgi:hypothetical protein
MLNHYFANRQDLLPSYRPHPELWQSVPFSSVPCQVRPRRTRVELVRTSPRQLAAP